ncbi:MULTISPECIES: DUF72 domain-containing protein [Phenylobacterium]|uniref:Uncharacterized protein YecE (DUF72 family) n=1 Tax=Phenylobacterium koreense TaxID=266125 RepID=A0ABV2EGH3_9CAUL
MTALRIGCSGWAYRDWVGPFYPKGTRSKDLLTFYASRFDTTEINASFYRLPSAKVVAGWAASVPKDFCFSWKVSRYITHNKKLRDCADSIDLVYDRMSGLGDREGPSLIQLPPGLRRDDARLADFLDLLPRGRHVVEFRHSSWFEKRVFDLLADRGVSLCISDHHHAPAPWEKTAPFVYVRGHGPGGRYRDRYPQAELKSWAVRIRRWRRQGADVYAYFDNDIKSAAPADAALLKQLIAS